MSKDLILMIEEFINNCSGSNLKFLEENNIVLSEKIETLLNTTPEHIKIILNNYLNNIDKINMEGKSLQKKRRE